MITSPYHPLVLLPEREESSSWQTPRRCLCSVSLPQTREPKEEYLRHFKRLLEQCFDYYIKKI
jgi:hypothetical protein